MIHTREIQCPQWGAGHRPGAANKREYGFCRIKKKRQKVTRTFRQSAGSTSFQSWEQKYVFRQRRTNFGVLSAKNQRWTWYAIERRWGGIIPARHGGKRQDRDLLALWELLKPCPIQKYHYHINTWEAYSTYIPPHRHWIGKAGTWKIERKNLNFRTHLKRLKRKTVCFSKNEQIHDNVIGMYIERFYYKTEFYVNNANQELK